MVKKTENIEEYKVSTLYFSPTGTTKRIVAGIANRLMGKDENLRINKIDFTLPKYREKGRQFSKDDLVIVGVPVYAGRVPNVLIKYLNSIHSNGALAVALVVYGNRNYDDALIELRDILDSNGFRVIAGAAFIGQHSFSNTLAKGRPDGKDMKIVNDFTDRLYDKIINLNNFETIAIKGNSSYRKYYKPIDKEGKPRDIRSVEPKTSDNCIDCKICSNLCPMGSIDYEDVSKLNGICIKCNACVKNCPTNSKYFDDHIYLTHKTELEMEFKERKEPEIFI